MLERIRRTTNLLHEKPTSTMGKDLVFGNPNTDLTTEAYFLSNEGNLLTQSGIMLREAAYSDYLDPYFSHGSAGRVTRRWIGNKSGTLAVDTAIKIPDLLEEGHTGYDQFKALRQLSRLGFHTVVPLFASRDRLITLWQNGEYLNPETDKKHFAEFIRTMGKMKYEIDGWDPDWIIDYNFTNFYARDLSSIYPQDWFLIIDPIMKIR